MQLGAEVTESQSGIPTAVTVIGKTHTDRLRQKKRLGRLPAPALLFNVNQTFACCHQYRCHDAISCAFWVAANADDGESTCLTTNLSIRPERSQPPDNACMT
jgi:hypothetical protein